AKPAPPAPSRPRRPCIEMATTGDTSVPSVERRPMRLSRTVSSVVVAALLVASVSGASAPRNAPSATAPAAGQSVEIVSQYIVQAKSAEAARQSVARVGVEAGQTLDIIHAVSAYLNESQVARLRKERGVRLFEDRAVSTRGSLVDFLKATVNTTNSTLATNPLVKTVTSVATPLVSTVTTNPVTSPLLSPVVKTLSSGALKDGTGVNGLTLAYETNYPGLIGADSLQRAGITGRGVTIAVLDTGLWQDTTQFYGSRILASVNVVNGGSGPVTSDPYGHGTHVTSIAASGAQALSGQYLGIAPKANLVIVRAFDGQGGGRYADVIAGLNWIVANKARYNIRVLNL